TLTNLYGELVERYPASAYTFGFQGQAQTLDQMWVSPAMMDELLDVRVAKINVDWPGDATGEAPAYGRFGVSDHDPEAGTFGVVSFDRVRALVDYLIDTGAITTDDAQSILIRLTNAENHLAAGRLAAAANALNSIVHTLEDLRAAGAISDEVAAGLSAEVQLLAP
ncbi:MAG TPA: hypothetical protein VK895_00040, partial [Jiangellaceae bacterium]|nr:hypothetical protein [Jiangellaceae bacterium]